MSCSGKKIKIRDNKLQVPDNPIIPFIEGDGIGPDITAAAQKVFNASVEKAYGGSRHIVWKEILAGEKANSESGEWLPQETLDSIVEHVITIKGPLTTPVGGGFRSLNVTIRQKLDLYACVRPVRYFKGTPSPVRQPELMDIVVFRENTEDVYAGIEWQAETPEVKKLISLLKEQFNVNIRDGSGVGIKPISQFGSRRLVRKAIRYAIDNNHRSVTLMHKGNIMKFTEGAFREWGYKEARENFPDRTITEQELWDKFDGKVPEGKILINDRIADSMFQQILTRTGDYDIIATPNLNGDYISDAAAAQVGGIGMAPGANLGDFVGVFEATHGTAPKYSGMNKANPSSLILSGALMLGYIGWKEATDLIENALEKTIQDKTVTYDLERLMEGATLLGSREFAGAIVDNM